MNTFYMDEAGYTGFDLLNLDQRFQGSSAIQIDEQEASRLINYYFPKTQLQELKHSKLSRRKAYWKPLIELQRELLNNHRCFSYVCDKRFLLILMFLDSCLEPALYAQGIDFYQDGNNYALASLLYYTAPTFLGEKNFNELLYLFQTAQHSKTNVAVEELVQKAIHLSNRQSSEYLEAIASKNQDCVNAIQNPETSTDAAYICAFSLISHIEKFVTEPYCIIHDQSKNLENYDKAFSTIARIKENTSFHQTSITTITFPLNFRGVSQIDSKESSSVQLADILIGGIIENIKCNINTEMKNEYNQEVIQLYGDENIIHLLPSLNFKEIQQHRQNTDAAKFIDFFAKEFYK